MKRCLFVLIILILGMAEPMQAQQMPNVTIEQSKSYYENARLEIESMLNGQQPLSYERAIFILENAWYDNKMNFNSFQRYLDKGVNRIRYIMSRADIKAKTNNVSNFWDALREKDRADKGYLGKTLSNYAIFEYMTDTSLFIGKAGITYHFPYTYAYADPFGSIDWKNTQVKNLLRNGTGNCFALASLFKIYADRLSSNASICTAPGHIYITHKDDEGRQYNIEIASKVFPGIGTLSTLTHTTQDAIVNDISLRQLNEKQSVALCLVYLAKGYQHKFYIKDDDGFMMSCSNLALKFDSLNLNAMLLKAEIMEDQIIQRGNKISQLQSDRAFKDYEQLITRLYKLGYREMPLSMKNILIKGWMKDTVSTLAAANYRSVEAESKIPATRKASLSWGLFEEEIADKPIEKYGRTVYNSKKKKIEKFVKEDVLYNDYNFDPVLFALSVDPLAHKFPHQSPYSAFGNNPIFYIDVGGAFQYPASKAASYTKDYPMITKYFANNIQNDVLKSTTVMQGMAKYSEGNLTKAQITKDTKWGEKSSPTIVFNAELKSDETTGFFGRYDASTNTINLSTDMADRIEKVFQTGTEKEKLAAAYELFSTTTHEEVHRGDYLDGQRQTDMDASGWGGEPGSAFMGDVFESKDVESDGQIFRVNTVKSVHGDSGELIEMQKQPGGRADVIPTIPTR